VGTNKSCKKTWIGSFSMPFYNPLDIFFSFLGRWNIVLMKSCVSNASNMLEVARYVLFNSQM